jgi:hypothetical protein
MDVFTYCLYNVIVFDNYVSISKLHCSHYCVHIRIIGYTNTVLTMCNVGILIGPDHVSTLLSKHAHVYNIVFVLE